MKSGSTAIAISLWKSYYYLSLSLSWKLFWSVWKGVTEIKRIFRVRKAKEQNNDFTSRYNSSRCSAGRGKTEKGGERAHPCKSSFPGFGGSVWKMKKSSGFFPAFQEGIRVPKLQNQIQIWNDKNNPDTKIQNNIKSMAFSSKMVKNGMPTSALI